MKAETIIELVREYAEFAAEPQGVYFREKAREALEKVSDAIWSKQQEVSDLEVQLRQAERALDTARKELEEIREQMQ